ncbi:MAG TPA: GNAT family N-acetyltransferase [Humisphaera sp.]|jgi:RimJ/RimL family protein N-acetyltransferase|nr:GNAT family N-acetyltransferase [Humisphaera sp.]
MASPILIRPIQLADVEAFAQMRIEAVRDYPLAFTADLGQTQGRSMDEWKELAARNAGDGAEVIMLADAGRALAGMSGVFVPKAGKLAHVGTIWGVYVRPAFRGQNVGRRLLEACIDWARKQRLVALKLSVVAGNDAAQRCYERCGFATYGVEPVAVRWEGKLYDEVLMGLRLEGGFDVS